MTAKRKAVVGVAVAVLVVIVGALIVINARDRGLSVRVEVVGRHDLVSSVTASGNIRARRTVDISSDIAARVAALEVDEGEDVQLDHVLLRLDPAQSEAAVARAEATLSQAKAGAINQQATLLRAQREFDRVTALGARSPPVVSRQEIEDAETALAVVKANVESAQFGVLRAQADLDEVTDRLSKTVIRAPISGKVTRLNIEEGETVVIGTMNNPGSLLLTISDLSVVEVVLQVDETDVPQLALGDSASVQVDAFPNQEFTGRITEIGNSAIRPPASSTASGQQAAIDFEVVITLDEPDAPLRPDLSATAEIITAERKKAVAVPIIALTVRDASAVEDDETHDAPQGEHDQLGGEERSEEVEGVFLVRDGRATFKPVMLGIAGQEHFEVLSGLEVGDTVVAGPYQIIRNLRSGDGVRAESIESPSGPAP